MTTIEKITLITAILGAVFGSLGAVLGIINTWHQMSKNYVKLKVIPKIAFMIDANNTITTDRNNDRIFHLLSQKVPFRLCIEIVNLSAFAVSISNVGFGKRAKLRHVLFQPELTSGKTWPPRLESRESIVAYAKIGERWDKKVMGQALAYAKTDCGVTRYGTSPIFKEYVQELHRGAEGNND